MIPTPDSRGTAVKGQQLAGHTLGKGYSDIVLGIPYGKEQAELCCDSNLQCSSKKGGGEKARSKCLENISILRTFEEKWTTFRLSLK